MKISEFATLIDRIETGSDKPQFVIDRLNIVNNADEDDTNPMGVSVFANSIDTLRKINLECDSYASEFDLGRKRIFVAPEIGDVIDEMTSSGVRVVDYASGKSDRIEVAARRAVMTCSPDDR